MALSLVFLLGVAVLAFNDSEVRANETGNAAEVTAMIAAAVETQDAEKTEGEKAKKKTVKPSAKKGKYYYKKTCKGCHTKDAEGGELTPVSKTIKQWERVFKKGKHYGEEMFDEAFDETQMIHIQKFLINHAADSDQPETCG